METEIVIDYTDVWPITCLFCGSDDVVYSKYADNTLCNCCGRWQIDEEYED